MDKKLYQEAIDYELLTKEIYQNILQSEDVTNVDVKHDTQIKGRSGIDHQVDVSWQFKQCGNLGTPYLIQNSQRVEN
ncbi:MAG: hypothetical protein L6Q53_12685 [Candidatus Brocadia sinica]|nr:hypothetical protein [Candidatus Brocadia sinica]